MGSTTGLPLGLNALPPSSMATFVRDLWPYLKNNSQTVTSGMLAEAWFFSVLKQLEGRGIRTVRSHEQAPTDGVLICFRPGTTDIPPAGQSWVQLLQWLSDHEGAFTLLHFDVKYHSLRSHGGQKNLPYAYTVVTENKHREHATAYVLIFDGLDDHIALVPKAVFERASSDGYGVDPLASRAPSWCLPFLVSIRDLGEAVNSLLTASLTLPYRNPTTQVVFHGWAPQFSTQPYLYPDGAPRSAVDAIVPLINGIASVPGWKADVNLVPPRFGDMWVWGEHLPQLVSVEHKIWDDNKVTWTADRTPFRRDKQWDFVIVSHPGSRKLYCCSRAKVPKEWYERTTFDLLEFQHENLEHSSIEDMLIFIAQEARNAIMASNSVGSELVREVLAATRTPETAFAALKAVKGLKPSREPSRGPERGQHARGLPWFANRLNGLFAEQGFLVAAPLDPFDIQSDRLVIEHDWTGDDHARYRDGVLPLNPFTGRGSEEVRCTVLRAIDMFVEGSIRGFPLWMRSAYWTQAVAEPKGFWLLGSTLRPAMYEHADAVALMDPYLLMPSRLTTLHASTQKRLPNDDNDTHAATFFQPALNVRDRVPGIDFPKNGHSMLRFNKGSKFVEAGVDPLRYVMDLDDVALTLTELFRGASPTMTVNSSLSRVTNGSSIKKADYITTVRQVHQNTWDYGLRRIVGKVKQVEGSDSPGKDKRLGPRHPALLRPWETDDRAQASPSGLPLRQKADEQRPPAKPLTAFDRYLEEQRAVLRTPLFGAKRSAWTKNHQKAWREMPLSAQQTYVSQYQREMQDYQTALATYQADQANLGGPDATQDHDAAEQSD